MLRLQALMQERGVTVAELARRVGASRHLVRLWVSGRVYPRAPYLYRIAQALDVTVDDLFERPKK